MISTMLRQIGKAVPSFTRESIAAYFGLPSVLFTQTGSTGPIMFHQAGAVARMAYQLRGAIFWPADLAVVPGLPRILTTSDHTGEAAAMHNDRAMIDLTMNGEAVVETKEPGIAVRLYAHRGHHYFATHTTHDGRDPLVGAGIENARALGVDVASQARRICDRSYPKAYRLASLGYTVVFALLLPERETLVPADRPDLVLVDVIDPDFLFVDRLEKERIADDYGLNVVEPHGRITGVANANSYFGRVRALELTAVQNDNSGFIVKGEAPDGERVCVRAEPSKARAWDHLFDDGDLKAACESALADFSDTILPAPFLEELMLEYLGSRRRVVRWQVADWITRR